jgi:hypothetical protein
MCGFESRQVGRLRARFSSTSMRVRTRIRNRMSTRRIEDDAIHGATHAAHDARRDLQFPYARHAAAWAGSSVTPPESLFRRRRANAAVPIASVTSHQGPLPTSS